MCDSAVDAANGHSDSSAAVDAANGHSDSSAAVDASNGHRSLPELAAEAALHIRECLQAGGGLLILTGAGMSVQSGVPVFRMADGTMTQEFLDFLGAYNAARERAGLEPADDWFNFSVGDMFRKETEKEAWQYWRWRLLRAAVEPALDYQLLSKLTTAFGEGNSFVVTSNCDMLHRRAGMPAAAIEEIHGTVGYLQCANGCTDELTEVTPGVLQRLEAEPEWVPRCARCAWCLRPNIMIFNDWHFEGKLLERQNQQRSTFVSSFASGLGIMDVSNMVVLEIGAGKVVSSIRQTAHRFARHTRCLIRINPDPELCRPDGVIANAYIPMQARSTEGLEAICAACTI